MRIGAQLWTVREYCSNLDDFAETLKKIADIGYSAVQVSGTCEFLPQWLKDQLDKNGLQCAITHTAPEKLIHNTKQVVRDHEIFRCDYVGLGYYPFQEEKAEEGYEHYIHTYLPVAKEIGALGKYMMHHTHDQEFQKYGDKLIIEHLMELFPEDCFGFTLDTYWMQAAGADPAQWIERLKGRVPCIHLKDFSYGRKMEAIGEGNMNFERIIAKAEAAGTKYMLVEQDDCNGENPFDCLKRSYDYLHALGF